MPSVKIGPEYFTNEFNEYANWRWAFVREIVQNSVDCGSRNIRFIVSENDDETCVVIENDGVPMTEDILVNKLLSLGSSGKNFEDGATGGFGKAKNILMFCHKAWKVTTGSLQVGGVGGDYELATVPHTSGTITEVIMAGCQKDDLLLAINEFLQLTQWSGTFYVNGEERATNLRKGSPRRDLGFGKVYTNRSFSHTMVVRINGIPMFTTSTNLNRCVIVELVGQSHTVLAANRDSLVSPYCYKLSDFVTELAVDTTSALKQRYPQYARIHGHKFQHSKAQAASESVGETQMAAFVSQPTCEDDHKSSVSRTTSHHNNGYENIKTKIGVNFITKNETTMAIPAYYDPSTNEFSSYSEKLTKMWGYIMLELHRLFDITGEFSIGFVFDNESTAQTECHSDYGRVYYLNPCKIVEQKSTYSKSFKKRFKLTDRDELIMVGLHEFIHGAIGCSWHDERYAVNLTDFASIVMKNRKRFNWCFK